MLRWLLLGSLHWLSLDGHFVGRYRLSLTFTWDDNPLDLADLLLCRLQVLFSLHSSLDLMDSCMLGTCTLYLIAWILRRIKQHSHSR